MANKTPESKHDNVDMLFEQYKIYVEMADRVSSRRIEANKYYSTILTGLFAGLTFVVEKGTFQSIEENTILLGAAILGVFTCILWYANLRSYSLLNSAKFNVIHQLEIKLPFAGFDIEWQILNEKKRRHIGFTKVERITPLIFLVIYSCLTLYSLYNLIN